MSAISTTTTASAPLNSAFAHRTPSSTIGDQASSSGLTATPPAQWVSATQVVPESDTAFTGLGETLTQGTSAASNGIIEIPWSGENGEPESKRSEEEELWCYEKGEVKKLLWRTSGITTAAATVLAGAAGFVVGRAKYKPKKPRTGGEQGSQGQSGTSDVPAAAGGPGRTATTAFELQDYSRRSESQSSLNPAAVQAWDPVTGGQR